MFIAAPHSLMIVLDEVGKPNVAFVKREIGLLYCLKTL